MVRDGSNERPREEKRVGPALEYPEITVEDTG